MFNESSLARQLIGQPLPKFQLDCDQTRICGTVNRMHLQLFHVEKLQSPVSYEPEQGHF